MKPTLSPLAQGSTMLYTDCVSNALDIFENWNNVKISRIDRPLFWWLKALFGIQYSCLFYFDSEPQEKHYETPEEWKQDFTDNVAKVSTFEELEAFHTKYLSLSGTRTIKVVTQAFPSERNNLWDFITAPYNAKVYDLRAKEIKPTVKIECKDGLIKDGSIFVTDEDGAPIDYETVWVKIEKNNIVTVLIDNELSSNSTFQFSALPTLKGNPSEQKENTNNQNNKETNEDSKD